MYCDAVAVSTGYQL